MLDFKYNLNCSICGLGGSIGVSSPKVKVGAKIKFGILLDRVGIWSFVYDVTDTCQHERHFCNIKLSVG